MENMSQKAPLIAAIDIGTNSFHMVIAYVNNRGMLEIRRREKIMVRLGSSGGDMKYIQPDAMDRAVGTLKEFKKIADSEKAYVRAVATSAVREAINQKEFLEKVSAEVGINIEVISGPEEGRLIYIGAMHALPIFPKKAFIIDIGGGSTETISGTKGEIIHVNSTKLGAIRLTKRFFDDGITTPERIEECRDYIKGNWAPTLKRALKAGFESVVGTSGTIQNLAAMTLSAKNEPTPDIINGLVVKREDILKVIENILNAGDTEARKALPGMDTKRADIIVGGALILDQAIKDLNIQKIIISSYALREGIVFDTVKKDKAIREFRHLSHLRYETIHNLCQQYRIDMNHAEHVRMTALRLFDDLQPLHNLGHSERELLESAALLHDAGYHIAHDQHHKHSYYLIRHSIMPGFTNNESELIANIARYHRKSHPKKKHDNFSKLSESDQSIVCILSGILRIAEGIDRRQLQIVKDVKAAFADDFINVNIYQNGGDIVPDIELWGAIRRKPLLEEALNRGINFIVVDKNEELAAP